MGASNTCSICEVFGCGTSGGYGEVGLDIAGMAGELRRAGLDVRATGEYDVPYYFCDIESLLFWLQAIPLPRDFDTTRHERQVRQIIDDFTTGRGIETNEHRLLLVAQKA